MELYRIAETRCPRSSGDRALASGARCAGSNPVEGTVGASGTGHQLFGCLYRPTILARSGQMSIEEVTQSTKRLYSLWRIRGKLLKYMDTAIKVIQSNAITSSLK